MGTRSLTKFYEEGKKKPFVTVYRQFDGYPTGHGVELVEFLTPRTLINGISGETSARAANGMGCLAAQFIARFKGDDIGNIYVVEDKDQGQDFEYRVYPNGADFKLKVIARGNRVIFNGNPDDFDAKKVEEKAWGR